VLKIPLINNAKVNLKENREIWADPYHACYSKKDGKTINR